MQWNPYLTFNGQRETAFKFYERCLGGKIVTMIPYGDTPSAECVPGDHRPTPGEPEPSTVSTRSTRPGPRHGFGEFMADSGQSGYRAGSSGH